MSVVDIIILLMLGLGAVVGFARGFLRQTVKSIGGILVVILAFIFKGPFALFLIKTLPTFNFKGIFNGITSMNILVYEVIAFVILLIVFGIIVRILFSIASFIENILNATILLAIPSKILGAIMGLAEAYLIIFVILFVLTLPVFNIGLINQSKYKDKILLGTPIVSSLAKKTVECFDDIYALRDELTKGVDRLQLDQKVLKVLIDNNLISNDKADELYEEGKLNAR
jgi:membrane protein required for colicin V production